MVAKIEGGCLCGKIRYTADAETAQAAVCHCRNCQKQSGSAFSIILILPAETLHIQGEMGLYSDKGDSGAEVHRRFCRNCGSPILSEILTQPTLRYLKAGTLDDPSWLAPRLHVYCRSAQPWVPTDSEARRYDGPYIREKDRP